ncbi:flagellar motor switch protein FliM [Miltoncostaea oceani]|uniref:flagellar motor switch protein FliM n=1 Tax=Miltoncostaea oceani TaxID=2843216 RepID=UPI001C3C88C5|nr:flagellar motor switch protein FliM [Miltoncostaea oceani]
MSEVLSQSEIDALLSAMSSGDLDTTQMHEVADEPQVRPFDFLRPSKFSKDQLRTIELLHDTFCRSAQTQLSGALRAMVEIEVVTADQVTYGEFVNSMPAPSLITIVTMEPLEGNAVVEVNLPIVFSIIDRLVGGPGTHRPKPRELTEIEHALVGGVIETLLRGFSEAWSTVVPARFRKVGTEMNPQFAQIVAPSDMVVLITFELRIGAQTGSISLCVPYLVLEPVMDRFTAQSYFSALTAGPSPEMREGIATELGSVSIPVSVELGAAELNVGDLLALAPGDVIPLSVAPGSDAVVRIGRREAFHAQPGVRGRHAAVQITGRIEDLERTLT